MAGPKLRGGRRMDLLWKQSRSKHKWQFHQQDWTLTHWSVSIRWVIQNGYRWTIQNRKKNSRLINLINNSSNYDIELFSRRFTSAQVVISCVYTFAKQQRQFTKDPNQICLTIEPTYSSTAELHFTRSYGHWTATKIHIILKYSSFNTTSMENSKVAILGYSERVQERSACSPSTQTIHVTSTIEVQVGTVVGRSINLPE